VARLQELQHDTDDRLLALTGFPTYELEPLLASEMNHLPEASETPEETKEKKKKSDKDLDARGITIQFNTTQKSSIDAAINKLRGEQGDFAIVPSECLTIICKQFLQMGEQSEE
jgi:hypothetical protein